MPRSCAWLARLPLHEGVEGCGLLPPDLRSEQESVVSVVCSSSVRAQGTVMTAVEVMHLLAAKWHPPSSQSALKTWRGRAEVSPPARTWTRGRALAPEPVPCQCIHQQAARLAGAGGPGAGTGLPGMSSAKHDGESCCEMVAVPVPSRTRAGEPSTAGNRGVLVHILRVLRSRERGGGLGEGAGASVARCKGARSSS